MEMTKWRKTLTALLLAVMLLAGSLAGALAEEAAVVADLTETTEEAEPVLLASVNGEEIWSNNEEMQELIDYYLSYYSSNGYDTSDQMLNNYLKAAGLNWAIESVLYHQKAEELGVSEIGEEQRAKLEENARTEWEAAVTYYAESLGNLTEESSEDEAAAARVDALAYIESNFGYTEDSYVSEYLENSRETVLRENVVKSVLGEFAVTEEELLDYFNSLVEEDKASYEGNIPMYEDYTQYMGSNSYYVPEGFRGITHILLDVDDELLNTYTSLAAQLEEQQEAETADENTAETAEAQTETADTAEPAETTEPEETKEPVTQEMVDAAKQAILDSVKDTVAEIMAKYESGTPFADLIAEYGTDPGMTVEPNKSNGYAVHSESILWDPAFTEGAMALEKVGDVSEPILGSYGIHILHYLRDIPAGAVDLTDEIRQTLKEELESEKETSAVAEMVEGWMKEAEIVYTDEGQAILDAAEAEEESVETTEATEEVLSNGD